MSVSPRTMSSSLFCVVSVLLLLLARTACAGGLRKSSNTTSLELQPDRDLEGAYLCNIKVVDAQFEDQDRLDVEEFKCMVDSDWNGIDDFAYDISLSDTFLAIHDAAIREGSCYIAIPDGELIDDGVNRPFVTVPDESAVEVVDGLRERHRRQLALVGTNSVLVVRVSANGGSQQVGASSNQLAGSVFGVGSQALTHSMKSQYEACSRNQLSFRPVTGNGVVNGIIDVTIPDNIQGVDIFRLTNIMNTAASDAVVNSLDASPRHVMYCVPYGTTFEGKSNWVAFAYVNGVSSYYNNDWCDRLSAQVHETGHNLGMQHSNENGAEYGDQSGMMGFSYPERDGPLLCFNAFKHYVFGWYSSHSQDITGASWDGELAAFVDVNQARSDQPVLLKMDDVYIQLNRRKGINSGTKERVDQVVLVQGNAQGNGDEASNVLAGLSAGETYNVNGRTVEVCEMNFDNGSSDYAKVSIYSTGQSSGCTTRSIGGGGCQDDPSASFSVGGQVRQCAWVSQQASYYTQAGSYWFLYGTFCGGLANSYCRLSCNTCV